MEGNQKTELLMKDVSEVCSEYVAPEHKTKVYNACYNAVSNAVEENKVNCEKIESIIQWLNAENSNGCFDYSIYSNLHNQLCKLLGKEG